MTRWLSNDWDRFTHVTKRDRSFVVTTARILMRQSKAWFITHSAGHTAGKRAWPAELSMMTTANINSLAENSQIDFRREWLLFSYTLKVCVCVGGRGLNYYIELWLLICCQQHWLCGYAGHPERGLTICWLPHSSLLQSQLVQCKAWRAWSVGAEDGCSCRNR